MRCWASEVPEADGFAAADGTGLVAYVAGCGAGGFCALLSAVGAFSGRDKATDRGESVLVGVEDDPAVLSGLVDFGSKTETGAGLGDSVRFKIPGGTAFVAVLAISAISSLPTDPPSVSTFRRLEGRSDVPVSTSWSNGHAKRRQSLPVFTDGHWRSLKMFFDDENIGVKKVH